MKRFLLFISALFICNVVIAHTINWHVDGNIYQTTTCDSGDSITPPNTDKTGYKFVRWDAYTPIEYLESDVAETQYIDTLYQPNSSTRTLFSVQPLFPYSAVTVMGTRNSQGVAAFLININTNGQVMDYYGSSSVIICTIDNTQKITIDKNKRVTTIYNKDGDIICNSTNNAQSFQTTPTLPFFNSMHIRVFYFKLYDNNTLVRDFIPVLDINNIPCMYDKVTKQFFYNQGTGQFIAGPVVSE